MFLYEIAIGIIMVMTNVLVYRWLIKREKCGIRESCALILGTAPIVFFSINMVSDTITADEMQYMNAIVNLAHIENANVAGKLMLQYRTSQMIFGTIFNLIPRAVFVRLSHTNLVVIYKILHWVFFYLIGLVIVFVIKTKYMKQGTATCKNMLAYLLGFFSVMSLPMTISVMKVCNYDATNVMFGSLGILLVGGSALEQNDEMRGGSDRQAKYGLLISILGCLDKWSSAAYFMICIVLYVYQKACKENKCKVKKILFETAKAIGFALVIGYINLWYINFILANGNLIEKISFGHIAFSFIQLYLIIFEGTVEAQVSDNALFYLALLYITVVIASFVLYALVALMKRKKNWHQYINRMTVFCLCIFILGALYSTYFIPQLMGPYAPVCEGEMSVHTSWGVYHYGAYSYLSHKIRQMLYAFATIVCNLPTSFLLLILIYIYLLFRNKIKEIIFQWVILGCLAVVCLFALMNQPSDPRYFGVCILLMILSIVSSIYNNYFYYVDKEKIIRLFKIGIFPSILLCELELAIYMPNIKIFSPIWNIRTQEWKESVRLGTWSAGEAMSWGEEVALAGKKIDKLIVADGLSPGDVTIYSDDYGTSWILNPGYRLEEIREAYNVAELDEREYYIFTKKRLFRMDELPPFLCEIKPIDTVEYRGEICSWIYKGSQLKDFQNYFYIGK